MSVHNTPEEYVAALVKAGGEPVNIMVFIAGLNKIDEKRHPTRMIDLSFAQELHKLVRERVCCIPDDYLRKFGVLAPEAHSGDVQKLLTKVHGFVENEDFRILGLQTQNSSRGRPRRNYLLHPRAFRACLMRSQSNPIYYKYYCLLEEAIVYYRDYQLEFEKQYVVTLTQRHKNEIALYNDTITKQTAVVMGQLNVIQEQSAENTSLLAELRSLRASIDAKDERTQKKLDGMDGELKEIKRDNKQLLDSQRQLAASTRELLASQQALAASVGQSVDLGQQAVARLEDVADALTGSVIARAHIPQQEKKQGRLSLIRLGGVPVEYVLLTGQKAHQETEKAKLRAQYPEYRFLHSIPCVPNALTLRQRVRERLGAAVSWRRAARFVLAGDLPMTEEALIARINDAHAERLQPAEAGAEAKQWAGGARVQITTLTIQPLAAAQPVAQAAADALQHVPDADDEIILTPAIAMEILNEICEKLAQLFESTAA